MQIYVGKARFQGPIARYAQRFDMVEVRADLSLPKPSRLAEWRRAVPERFVFSVVVPRSLASLELGPEDASLLRAQNAADALSAGFWLLVTPATVTPAAGTRDDFRRLVEALRHPGRRIAWEPRGPWSEAQAEAFAEQLGIHLVNDLARPGAWREPRDVVYTRLRALGPGARIGAGQIERVAEQLDGASEAFVVVEGAGALGVRKALREALIGHDADAASDEEVAK